MDVSDKYPTCPIPDVIIIWIVCCVILLSFVFDFG